MKIKRYFAPDIRQALRLVREGQGPDAVILSNREVDGGVEIVAAVDYDALLAEAGVTTRYGSGADTAAGRGAGAEAAPEASAPQDDSLLGVRSELTTLRGMLEHQLSDLAWGELERKHPRRALLIRRLRELGLGPTLARRIAEGVSEEQDFERLWREGLALLARSLAVTDDDIVSHGGVVALIGPTGVGKTTTAAKLAARYILRHGARSVALVTTDDQRIGAHEQLKIFGRILDVPVRAARDADSLRAVLAELAAYRLVLIDTAGMGQRDVRLSEQFQMIHGAGRPIRSHLVLAATGQLPALEETVRAFAPGAPQACIVTKLDETTSLGGVLSVAAQHRLAFAYLSDGQRVPEDLRPARAHTLVARCVAIHQQTRQMLAGAPGTNRRKAANA
jgi:flagellar biosynthesis protein FlhF